MECWRCRYPFEWGSHRAPPVEGDVTLCWQCGTVGIVRLVEGAAAIDSPTAVEVEELTEVTPTFLEVAARFELDRRQARKAANGGA